MKFKFLPLLFLCITAAQGQEAHEYKPDFQQVSYRSNVPLSVRRVTNKVGPTRFYGSFQRGQKRFAVHFYDISRNRSTEKVWKRDSRLDIFQATTNKTWQRIQSFSVTRRTGHRKDRLTIEAKALWFDPAQKTIPMIYLHVMEHEDRKEIWTGNQTDIYGILFDPPRLGSFIAFKGFNPYSMTTVTLSKISYPDSKGHLTILNIISDTGDATHTAYGWADTAWKIEGKTDFQNGYETALA